MRPTLEAHLPNPKTPLEREIAELGPWFHNLHLPDGTQTAPLHALGDFPSDVWAVLSPHLPENLSGQTVLDIGCNAGFYTFELAKRGARVTSIDLDERYLKQARWAAKQLSLENRVEFHRMQIYDLARFDRDFDIILFMGVFYHLRYPLLGLDIVARKLKRTLVFQTLAMPGEEVADTPDDLGIDERERLLEPGWPKAAFIEKSLQGDCTNWWAPNHAAIEAMLRSANLRVVKRPVADLYFCEPQRNTASDELALKENEYRAALGL